MNERGMEMGIGSEEQKEWRKSETLRLTKRNHRSKMTTRRAGSETSI